MLSLNGWSMFFTVLNVLVLFWGLKKFLFKPVLKVIRQREEIIQSRLEGAAEKEKEAEQLKRDYQEKLKCADQKAEEILVQAKERAGKEQNAAMERAQKETEKMLGRARDEIRQEQEKARREVQAEVAVLAMETARKILKTGDVHETAGR